MSNEKKEGMTDRRTGILIAVASELRRMADEAQKKAVETMKSKTDVDGPWQSKQPDEMIKIELQAGIYQERAANYRKKGYEIDALLVNNYKNEGRIGLGSILVWEMKDPEHEKPFEEIVVITPSGGGKFADYRLLSEKAPLARAIIGRSVGDTVEFGEITVVIKELV